MCLVLGALGNTYHELLEVVLKIKEEKCPLFFPIKILMEKNVFHFGHLP